MGVEVNGYYVSTLLSCDLKKKKTPNDQPTLLNWNNNKNNNIKNIDFSNIEVQHFCNTTQSNEIFQRVSFCKNPDQILEDIQEQLQFSFI